MSILPYVALLSIGCSVAVEDYEADEDLGTTHAVIKIRHLEAREGDTRGDALAGFVRVPPETDPATIFALAGLEQPLPPPGECRREGFWDDDPDYSKFSRVELLEAQSVALFTEAGVHELAPFAIPTVADFLRGVVYTSRNRDAAALPTGASYTLEGHGIGAERDGEGATLLVESLSPAVPRNVKANGTAWRQLRELPPSRVLDLSWEKSDDLDDLIVVTLRTNDFAWHCSFADSEGFGSLPLVTESGVELAHAGNDAQLEIHRIRAKKSSEDGDISQVWVTFDFALEAQIRFNDTVD